MWYNSRVMSKLNIAIVAAILLAHPCEASEGRKPNVIFLLADDLGYGDVGFCPCPATNVLARLRTRHIDALARGGVVMTSHYAAAPVSAPSRASILTGRVQGECSLRDNCFDRPFAETNTLATVLHGAGYATWAVGKWGVAGGGESGEPVKSHPLDRGFDYFYGFLDHMAGHTYYHYRGYIRGAYMGVTENRADATDGAVGVYSTDLYIAKAKSLIRRHVAAHSSSISQSTPCTAPGTETPPFPARRRCTCQGARTRPAALNGRSRPSRRNCATHG